MNKLKFKYATEKANVSEMKVSKTRVVGNSNSVIQGTSSDVLLSFLK